jgi:hypothetical protein
MSDIKENIFIISRNTTKLLNAFFHLEQLLSNDPRRITDIREMMKSATAIRKAGNEIYEMVETIADGEKI